MVGNQHLGRKETVDKTFHLRNYFGTLRFRVNQLGCNGLLANGYACDRNLYRE